MHIFISDKYFNWNFSLWELILSLSLWEKKKSEYFIILKPLAVLLLWQFIILWLKQNDLGQIFMLACRTNLIQTEMKGG